MPLDSITEIIVCTTCRPAGASRAEPAAGELLLEAVYVAQLQADATHFAHLRVRGVECMSSCSRACLVAFQAPGKHSYLFGGLAPDATTADQVLACARLHAHSADGSLLRKDRPERLRNGIVARLPAVGT
jgi:predicted metal-binding protein